MVSIYQVLDLKNEIEKFRYYLIEKYRKNTVNSLILNTFKVEVKRLYEDEFLYEIIFNDYVSFGKIEIYFRKIGDYEIKYKLDDEIFNSLKLEFDEYLNNLFKLNYRMKF